jgi:hypothetical protein
LISRYGFRRPPISVSSSSFGCSPGTSGTWIDESAKFFLDSRVETVSLLLVFQFLVFLF